MDFSYAAKFAIKVELESFKLARLVKEKQLFHRKLQGGTNRPKY